ncbi:hypothetical protein EU245_11655 [Lentibacillus lipolyticus]|nr:hypothetical protein EU245_11655 [Lentibacillus lipolyticus]
MEEFYSSEGTKYIWDSSADKIIDLTPSEVQMTKIKVKLMSDHTILNRDSANNIPMGIPLELSTNRLKEVYANLRRILRHAPEIHIESHAIDRLIEDWALVNGDPKKRDWVDEDDIRNCVRTAHKVIGLRLNVNHHHVENSSDVKYLHPQLAITLLGEKASGNGRLVSAVLGEKLITVITIL